MPPWLTEHCVELVIAALLYLIQARLSTIEANGFEAKKLLQLIWENTPMMRRDY